ncbi:MAG TPA: DUF4157 domain-containing protein, partial [Gemmataceae bacterium]|nr:DUF4157 domain-containing protein [Gemmataceae bacterium]
MSTLTNTRAAAQPSEPQSAARPAPGRPAGMPLFLRPPTPDEARPAATSDDPLSLPQPPPAATAIPDEIRAGMEAVLGADFSGVQLHKASGRAAALGAAAFAQGAEVHVAPGHWAPESVRGRELLGHELWHVVQQREGRAAATARRAGVAVNDHPALEAEADAMGARAGRADTATHAVRPAPARSRPAANVTVQMQPDPDAEPVPLEPLLLPGFVSAYAGASSDSGLDLAESLAKTTRTALADHGTGDELGRAEAEARAAAAVRETVDTGSGGALDFDSPGVLAALDKIHRDATGIEGVQVSAGLREMARVMAGHAASAVVAAMPEGATYAGLYEWLLRQDIAAAGLVLRDADALLRL